MADVLLTGVTRRYAAGDAPAVDDVSLEVPDGQLFALLGPSGCGKSTLLKLIGGLEEPDAGEIHIGDRLVNFVSPGRRDVAMVFQSYALYPHMTARENICFPLKMRRVPRDDAARAVDRAADVLELGELMGRKVESLSGGQRQRIAVARAIVRDPAVLLMDEPLSNLDALLRMHTREELLRLHRAVPGTILYVTHDQVEAMTMGDRIGVMDRGRLAQVGTPLEVYQRPATRFVAGFIGTPPMSFVDGQLTGDEGALIFHGEGVSVRLREELARAAVRAGGDRGGWSLGIRPEAVQVSPSNGRPSPWRVDVVEDLGAECIIGVRHGSTFIRSRPGFGARIAADGLVDVALPGEVVHLFDAGGRNVLA